VAVEPEEAPLAEFLVVGVEPFEEAVEVAVGVVELLEDEAETGA